MDKKQTKEAIDVALAEVTATDIAAHAPPPAPVLEGETEARVLMQLDDHLVRFYTRYMMIEARYQANVLQFYRTILRSVHEEMQQLIGAVMPDALPAGMTFDDVKRMADGLRGNIEQAFKTNEITELEPLDQQILEAFPAEMQRLVHEYFDSLSGDEAEIVKGFGYGVFVHNGQWVLAAAKRVTQQERFAELAQQMFGSGGQVPDHVMQQLVKKLLADHPGSVHVTNPATLDLSEFPKETHDEHRRALGEHIARGEIVIDHGAGKKPRFLTVKARFGLMDASAAGGELAEALQEALAQRYGSDGSSPDGKGVGSQGGITAWLAGGFGKQ